MNIVYLPIYLDFSNILKLGLITFKTCIYCFYICSYDPYILLYQYMVCFLNPILSNLLLYINAINSVDFSTLVLYLLNFLNYSYLFLLFVDAVYWIYYVKNHILCDWKQYRSFFCNPWISLFLFLICTHHNLLFILWDAHYQVLLDILYQLYQSG